MELPQERRHRLLARSVAVSADVAGSGLDGRRVAIEGFDQRVGPLSTVLGCALANALVAEVVAGLVARGVEPPVFISANVDGGDERNARLLALNRERIHYMD